MDLIQHYSGIDTPPPAGSYSVAVAALGFIFLSGQTPRDPDGARRSDLPFREQVELALSNLAAAASSAGTSLGQAVSVTVYLSDISYAHDFDAIYKRYFSHPYPSRTLVAVSLNSCAVEISAILTGSV